MTARFATNFAVLLLGAAVLVLLFAFGRPLTGWVALGAGAAAIVMALYSFAMPAQGVYQRVADPVIVAVGTWAIVAARVMNDRSIWLVFSAGAGLLALGALGLVVREIDLTQRLGVSESSIGPDTFARLSTMPRGEEVSR
jgi:hypothetical protein